MKSQKNAFAIFRGALSRSLSHRTEPYSDAVKYLLLFEVLPIVSFYKALCLFNNLNFNLCKIIKSERISPSLLHSFLEECVDIIETNTGFS